jgi:hypothetical protein
MARDFRGLPTKEQLGSAAQIRRAERTLHKDLRFMIRENKRRRDRNEKGPGGVRLPDEFAELRKAKLDVSRMAADLVQQRFGPGAARMFRFRAFLRQQAWELIPDRAAQLFRGSRGRSNQSRHDEGRSAAADTGATAGASYAPRTSPAGSSNLPAVSQAWVGAAEGKAQRRAAHTAVGVAALMTASRDLQIWYRNEPQLMNRTRDLYAWAEQRRAEAQPFAPRPQSAIPRLQPGDPRPQYSYGVPLRQQSGAPRRDSYDPPALRSPDPAVARGAQAVSSGVVPGSSRPRVDPPSRIPRPVPRKAQRRAT